MNGFDTILVANRGEIASRVIRSARAMGYRTVAVYSDADAGMPHVHQADVAVHIGPAPAKSSYLDIGRLIAAARDSGTQAIHPGYGFLSESAAFAQACADAGIVFIGPSPGIIEMMGDKAQAKARALAAGVPCIPGYMDADQSPERLALEAESVGYPLMIKAVAGGGGKGMRLVAASTGLVDALALARSEAEKAFGSGAVMLERALMRPRHVEVQVFGDTHGNVVHLGCRDCSIQRRHQKVVEEAPAPGLDPALEAAITEAAVAAARAVAYVGAGTVEFLVEDGEFYFLEMNTRLQVEHPVTEMVTGLDLVEWQIRVAAGETLPLAQHEIALAGHAIEVRLYAEDPANGFLPQTGPVLKWDMPRGEGVRVDAGIEAGVEISTHYDPMLAKIIAWGSDRAAAQRRLVRALDETVLVGLRNNLPVLLDIVASDAFRDVRLSTRFLEEDVAASTDETDAAKLDALAAALFYDRSALAFAPALRGWRSRPWGAETLVLSRDGERIVTSVRPLSADSYEVGADGEEITVAFHPGRAAKAMSVEGAAMRPDSAWQGEELHLSLFGLYRIYAPAARLQRKAPEDGQTVAVAPMPGAIQSVRVTRGERVARGDTLLILEAMKMEHPIPAPVGGTVKAVLAHPGEQVRQRQPLVEIAPDEEAAT